MCMVSNSVPIHALHLQLGHVQLTTDSGRAAALEPRAPLTFLSIMDRCTALATKFTVMAYKVALLGMCILGSLAANPAQAITDVDIMNFALNLECLEATYYSTAVNGFGLNATTLGGGPQGVGGGKASLSPDLIKIATEIANDEIDHVSP